MLGFTYHHIFSRFRTIIALTIFSVFILWILLSVNKSGTHNPISLGWPPVLFEHKKNTQKSVPEFWHEVLSDQCYSYKNLREINKCCKPFKYDVENFEKCAHMTPKWFQSVKGRNVSGMHWLFIGDSHIRQLSTCILDRIRSPMFLYRKKWFKEGEFRPIENSNLSVGIYISLKHKTIPLTVTYIWDTMLMDFKHRINRWLAEEEEAPTHIVLSSVHHWILEKVANVSDQEKLKAYRDHLSTLAIPLQKLTKKALVAFQLLDHQAKRAFRPNRNEIIDNFNQVAKSLLSGKVTIWNSMIPLSDLYRSECEKNPRDSNDGSKDWICSDVGHTGNIIIKRAVDMILNYGCNRILQLDSRFCQ